MRVAFVSHSHKMKEQMPESGRLMEWIETFQRQTREVRSIPDSNMSSTMDALLPIS